MRVFADVDADTYVDGDYGTLPGTCATCLRCGHYTESYGTEEGSILRCLALLREECPKRESNFYVGK